MTNLLGTVWNGRREAVPAEMEALYQAELERMGTGFQATPVSVKVEHRRRVFAFPDGEEARELVGVILDSRIIRGYWDSNSGDKRPAWFSADGLEGEDAAGGRRECVACPRNQFGSKAGGRGKACKEMRRLLFLPEGYAIPVVVTVPPTSLRGFDRYATALAMRRTPLSAVVTRIGLEAAQSGGNEDARMVFERAGTLGPEEFRRAVALRDEVLRAADVLAQAPEEDEAGEDRGAGAAPDLASLEF